MTRNRRKNSGFSLLLPGLILALLPVSGCKKKDEKPAASPAPAAAKPAATPPIQKQLSSPKLPPAQANQFDFSTKKDPFKPIAIVKTPPQETAAAPKRSGSVLPINSFDVNQFRLIGIVVGGKDGKDGKAMVVDPNGKGYVLKVGMTIGKNFGQVTAITRDSVDVVEQFRDDNGKVRKEHIRITLPRKQ